MTQITPREEARYELARELVEWRDFGGDVFKVVERIEAVAIIAAQTSPGPPDSQNMDKAGGR